METAVPAREPVSPFDVTGHRILVTGSSRGIGRVVANHLARAGAQVVVHGRDREALEESYENVGATGWVSGDLRDADQVERAIGSAVTQLDGLDGLVNNAGGAFVARAESLSQRGFEAVLATNLTSVFLAARAAQPHLAVDGGAVVNISSLASIRPSPGLTHYAAAKAGVNQLTTSLAAEWAGSGIRVNAVVVGSIATDAGLEANYGGDPDKIAAAERRIGVGRLGVPEDVAHATHFLLSAGSGFVNGTSLVMDGGPPDEYVV